MTTPGGIEREQAALAELPEATRASSAADSEAAFRALAEAASEAILLHRAGVIVLANHVAESLVGSPPGGLVGRSLFDFVAPEARALVAARAASSSQDVYESIAQRADGARFPVEVRGGEVPYRGESLRLVALRDLTERRLTERKLALTARLASIGQLAGGIAHEINNPLSYVLLNLQLAQRQIGNLTGSETILAELHTCLRDASEGAQRVRDIVDDLRKLARDPTPTLHAVDLGAAIRFAASVARAELRPVAHLRVDAPSDVWVRGDQTRLGQVFLNLLVNAAQACASLESPDHEIALHVERHGERVRVTVSDTGPGIAPDLLPHVFEPFVTTRHGAQGTGLGLSIVREIVLACGGSVDASSEPGRGARFVVELASAERPEPGERPQPAMARARARVLLVDDEPQLRAVVERVLADAHDVSSAGSGAAALALLEREERFDVLVCDLTMPGMSGAELLEIVTQRWPELGRHTVITTGGLVSERVAAIAQSAGIPVLAKPFSAETLLRVVAELVTRGGSTR